MKKTYASILITFFIITILTPIDSYTLQSDDVYLNTMNRQVDMVTAVGSLETYQQAVSMFTMISERYPEEWHPHYYKAYTYTMMAIISYSNPEGSDAVFERYGDVNHAELLGEAKKAFEKADGMVSGHSELLTMRAFIMMARLQADSELGQQIGSRMSSLLNEAIQRDEANPRPASILAQLEFGTALFFGETPDKACARAVSSMVLFEEEKERQANDDDSRNTVRIAWGEDLVEGLVAYCRDAFDLP